jgi:ribulose-bisphosphate carboxylase small chain
MWKLPIFGETEVGTILAEAEACHKAHPMHYVRLIGYQGNYKQSQDTAMVVFHGSIKN